MAALGAVLVPCPDCGVNLTVPITVSSAPAVTTLNVTIEVDEPRWQERVAAHVRDTHAVDQQ